MSKDEDDTKIISLDDYKIKKGLEDPDTIYLRNVRNYFGMVLQVELEKEKKRREAKNNLIKQIIFLGVLTIMLLILFSFIL